MEKGKTFSFKKGGPCISIYYVPSIFPWSWSFPAPRGPELAPPCPSSWFRGGACRADSQVRAPGGDAPPPRQVPAPPALLPGEASVPRAPLPGSGERGGSSRRAAAGSPALESAPRAAPQAPPRHTGSPRCPGAAALQPLPEVGPRVRGALPGCPSPPGDPGSLEALPLPLPLSSFLLPFLSFLPPSYPVGSQSPSLRRVPAVLSLNPRADSQAFRRP